MVIEVLVDHFDKINVEVKRFKALGGTGKKFGNFLLVYSRISKSVVLQKFDHWLEISILLSGH